MYQNSVDISKILVIILTICLIITCLILYRLNLNKENQAIETHQATDTVKEAQTSQNLVESISEDTVQIVQTSKDISVRVALTTEDFTSIYHDFVSLNYSEGLTVKSTLQNEITETSYPKGIKLSWSCSDIPEGTMLEIVPDNPLIDNNEQTITAQKEGIQISSLTREYGHPSYSGNLQVYFTTQGIIIVNIIPIEQYLCLVVPSEISAQSPMESIKAQVVCARSYALKKIQENADEIYDVTDSTADQVYNNQYTTKEVCQAVTTTTGEIVEDALGEVVDTYYYSTSWGYSTDSSLIDLPDVSTETGFREFYYHWNNYVSVSYDEDAPWFRWTINCDKTELNHLLQEKMQVQEETDADAKILKYKTESGETLLNYQNIQKTIQKAEIDSIEVVNRGTDGSVIQLQIKYRTGGILNIYTATAIREWLGSSLWEIHKQDGSDFTGWSILPSAFFYVETQRDEITVYGGGFGHGTGMSQNAAKTMGMKGFSYQEILTFFYKKGT